MKGKKSLSTTGYTEEMQKEEQGQAGDTRRNLGAGALTATKEGKVGSINIGRGGSAVQMAALLRTEREGKEQSRGTKGELEESKAEIA